MLNLFKNKDPVCGMKKENGKGIEKHGEWFCCEECLKVYEKKIKRVSKGCCG